MLAKLRIASPCQEPWSGMAGDDRVRHCGRCDRQVVNLSAMTRGEAEASLAAGPCVRFLRRADGSIVTRLRIATVAAGTLIFGAAPAMADPLHVTFETAPDAVSGAIQGVVKDGETKEVLPGVTVVIAGSNGVMETAITDESGFYQVTSLPPATDYVATFYYADLTVDRKGISVGAETTTPVDVEMKTSDETIIVDRIQLEQGIPSPMTYTGVLGEPTHRHRFAWSTWARFGLGAMSEAPGGAPRSLTPSPREREQHLTAEAALGADLTVALHKDLRFGAWTEVRTSSGPVLGGELRLNDLSMRVGAGAHVVTAAIAYGYFVVSATRGIDDGRDWTATAGYEFDPVRAFRYVLRRARRPP
jgi:hypothetical protein